MNEEEQYTPAEGTYVIKLQPDGNYMGWTRKNGKIVEIRDIGPETVMMLLITHDGK